MDPIKAMFIIAIIYLVLNYAGKGGKFSRHTNQHNQDDNGVSHKELQLEIMALKKRIESLEAIVTDKSYNLKKEIDDL